MFEDCKTDLEKNEYKKNKLLQMESEEWLKINYPDVYRSMRIDGYAIVFEKICRYMDVPRVDGRFLYFVDTHFLFDTTRGYRFENLTPGYDRIVKNGLKQLMYYDLEGNSKFCEDYNRVIAAMVLLSDRIANVNKGTHIERIFRDLKDSPANGFEDALQRILFANQLLWQMGHRLIGLGDLDQMLWELYLKDKNNGVITREEAKKILVDFFQTLHKYYWLKSNVLMGDTGQIIILGGKNYNELTELFIEVTTDCQLPDPKILLRVNKSMPRNIMELAVKCMKTGVGSPILANDEVIIPRLTAYGISESDANKYGVSACWEPLIPGKSISPNNITYLNMPKVVHNAIVKGADRDLKKNKIFEDFMILFYEELKVELERIRESISEFRLQYNPLLSVFTDDCFVNKKDVSFGGAKYCNYGITVVGMSNAVNSLLNIKKYVYSKSEIELDEVQRIIESNFKDKEDFAKSLKDLDCCYGKDDCEVISLTNDILLYITDVTKDFRNYMGGGLKVGVSAPSYVDAAKDAPASFDGRMKGTPFGVHISSESNNGYTEIINFAAQLDYNENRFNGNVVDIMVSPSFIENNFDKMVELLLASISVGFFELQMNVVSSDVLIDAKSNPNKYPNLVVRVWGFSAYFNELPESYQDVLIQRALENERRAS